MSSNGQCDSSSSGFKLEALEKTPSKLVTGHGMILAPSKLFSESMPLADLASLDSNESGQSPNRINPDLVFAPRSPSLGYTAGSASVIDPDSVLDESGRLYHGYKDGAYFLPNDAAEQDRLDLQHKMFDIMLDGWLALAPMASAPKYVLDIATGTGIWAIEFAKRYPSSFVIGIDLSAIQAVNQNITNCIFQKADAEAPWRFPAPHPAGKECVQPCQHKIQFEYIHLRMVCTCFDDSRGVMKQAYENVSPGGWIEYQDFFCDTSHENNKDTALARWYDAIVSGARTLGRDLRQPIKYHQWLEEAGFTNVTTRALILPCSPWPREPKLKEAGKWQLANFLDGIHGVSGRMMTAAGYSGPQIEESIEQTKEYLRSHNSQPLFWLYVVYGQKPFSEEVGATDTSMPGQEFDDTPEV